MVKTSKLLRAWNTIAVCRNLLSIALLISILSVPAQADTVNRAWIPIPELVQRSNSQEDVTMPVTLKRVASHHLTKESSFYPVSFQVILAYHNNLVLVNLETTTRESREVDLITRFYQVKKISKDSGEPFSDLSWEDFL